ncbi:PRC-barrel domain-containing protein [Thermoactinospora rubra]|uniref:PRC-barrel domain-containing protein n=1 Tax=Thermoactinospora rubra TaxID=1088767 RepID=UPI000A113728|nr:PRC-barrel domain-containing protein [Thermoactinospora rubra]
MELWDYRPDVYDRSKSLDLVGYHVQATDGKIGSVDEATYEVGESYLIVDTGPWIFGKKVMLPASVITQIDPQERNVYVSRTKAEIKDAPEFDEAAFKEPEYRNRLGDYYRRFPAGPGATF